MRLCDYGCGQEAKFQFKNGKWCCCEKVSGCPHMKEKNSLGQKLHYEKYPEKRHFNSGPSWNKGLTAKTCESIKNATEKIKAKYASGELIGSFKGHKHSEESKKKIGAKLKGNHHNDPNKTGRGKKGYYKGFYCASTYELAYVIYCLDHNIQIERCKEYFEYEYQGQKHRYYPDFVVNDEIVEIKGFWNGRVNAKRDAVLLQNKKYKILFPKDMDFIFKYIEEKYGKLVDRNISDLYE